jgi:adenylate cyclase
MDMTPAVEIERKFVLEALPPVDVLGRGTPIRQYYLPGSAGEVRARQKGERFFLTAKGEGTLVRPEWEVEMPAWAFDLMRIRCREPGLEKTRYEVPHDGHVLIVDEYSGALAGLVTLECEFDDVEAAAALRLPEWASGAVDVTEDRRYKNSALALGGAAPSIVTTSTEEGVVR